MVYASKLVLITPANLFQASLMFGGEANRLTVSGVQIGGQHCIGNEILSETSFVNLISAS